MISKKIMVLPDLISQVIHSILIIILIYSNQKDFLLQIFQIIVIINFVIHMKYLKNFSELKIYLNYSMVYIIKYITYIYFFL